MKEQKEPVCQCMIPDNLKRNQMYDAIAAYIRNLPEELCAEDSVYEERLNRCSTCPALIGGLTCKYCGCFVLARARKKDQTCPMPGDSQWEQGNILKKI